MREVVRFPVRSVNCNTLDSFQIDKLFAINWINDITETLKDVQIPIDTVFLFNFLLYSS